MVEQLHLEVVQPKEMRLQEYLFTPPLDQLRSMPREQLEAVKGFCVERKGFGRLAWEQPVDLRMADLTRVRICRGGAQFDPLELPMLNCRCVITAERMLPRPPLSQKTIEAHALKLRKQIRRAAHEFLSYDPSIGQLKFRVSRFS